MDIKKLVFPIHADERGQLVALEEFRDTPFEVKRVYYIFDAKNDVKRGQHAHKNLEQLLICLNGGCKVLLDNGIDKGEVVLDKPNEALYIPNNTWREIYDFKPGTIILVFASKLYDPSDYIRTYDEFLEFVNSDKEEEK